MLYLFRCASPEAELPAIDLPELYRGERLHVVNLPQVPGRRDLKLLDALPKQFVTGQVASLAEIAAMPDVEHQGPPVADPHPVSERVRVIVEGSDAALAAVVAKLMRIDALWVQVAFVPRPAAGGGGSAGAGKGVARSTASPTASLTASSAVAQNWGLIPDASFKRALAFALDEPARPTSLIRDDHGQVILGAAEILGGSAKVLNGAAENLNGAADGAEPRSSNANEAEQHLIGEVIVDSDVLYSFDPEQGRHSEFNRGVRMVPTMGAPGLAAVALPPAPKKRGLFSWFKQEQPLQPVVLKGRALQAGGVDMVVVRDGVAHPRPLKSITIYRHLRDAQFVRN